MAARPPNEAITAFAREQAELAAAGDPTAVAPLGTQVADAELIDVDGAPTTLYAATSTGPSVVVFYRGAWCPYCNLARSTYQQHLLPQLAERATPLVAISPQTPDGSLSMQQKHDLAFTVLSDPGNTIARGLHIMTQPSQEARAAQLQLGLDLTTVNADGTTALPMPSVLVLDAEHAISSPVSGDVLLSVVDSVQNLVRLGAGAVVEVDVDPAPQDRRKGLTT